MNITMWTSFVLVLCITSPILKCSSLIANESEADEYEELNDTSPHAALNCTTYVQTDVRQWMSDHKPGTHKKSGSPMNAPLEFVVACLRGELKHVNETSPFWIRPDPVIEYNMALNEVTSLGFDGVLVTKVCPVH